MAQYIAAIDQGTGSTRCIIFDHEANVVAAEQREHAQIHPRPGWVEHDPLEIMSAHSGGGSRGPGRGSSRSP